MSNKAKRTLHPELRMFDRRKPNEPFDPLKSCNTFAVPTFFVDELMPLGKGLPAAFWKLTFVVLRIVLAPELNKQSTSINDRWIFNYVADTTDDQIEEAYNIGNTAVSEWRNAYEVSGLFKITKGAKKHPKFPGSPTLWQYKKNATDLDWKAFIIALSQIVNPALGQKRMARSGKIRTHLNRELYAANQFKLALALRVDSVRSRINGTSNPGLAPVNTDLVEEYLRLGYGNREEDGSISYLTLKPSWKGLEIPDYQGEGDLIAINPPWEEGEDEKSPNSD